MSQHDFNIANQGFPAFRSDLNSALLAIRSTSSGATAPTPTEAGMLWYDTATSTLKRRNTTNTLWIDVNSDTLAATVVRGNASGGPAAETSITMASLRAIIGFPTATVGLGVWALYGGAPGANFTLPAGGTYAYFAFLFNSGNAVGTAGGVAAGGSVVGGAVAGQNWSGFTWRIA